MCLDLCLPSYIKIFLPHDFLPFKIYKFANTEIREVLRLAKLYYRLNEYNFKERQK